MNTYRNLYPQIIGFENLYLAFCKARKGDHDRPEVAAFELNLEADLFQLEDELAAGSTCRVPIATSISASASCG